jgi:hypothetical protein
VVIGVRIPSDKIAEAEALYTVWECEWYGTTYVPVYLWDAMEWGEAGTKGLKIPKNAYRIKGRSLRAVRKALKEKGIPYKRHEAIDRNRADVGVYIPHDYISIVEDMYQQYLYHDKTAKVWYLPVYIWAIK